MSRGKIKFTALIFAIVILFANICAYAKVEIPQATDRFFVNDYANVIDGATEDYIFDKGKTYNANGGPQIVVLTMESIDGASVEKFALDTAREWGIGDKEENNGVLILLVIDSRDIRIEVGYGLEGVLNDGKCGRFIRRATDLLSAGDYSEGIKQIYDDVIGELENPTSDTDMDDDELSTMLVIFIMLIVVIIISRTIGRGGRGGSGGRYRHYPTGRGVYFGGFSSGRSSFGGGGFSGGGGSFGGGGFSGGGGSFGGGGASGKF